MLYHPLLFFSLQLNSLDVISDDLSLILGFCEYRLLLRDNRRLGKLLLDILLCLLELSLLLCNELIVFLYGVVTL